MAEAMSSVSSLPGDAVLRLLPGERADVTHGEELALRRAHERGGRATHRARSCCRCRRTRPHAGRDGAPASSRRAPPLPRRRRLPAVARRATAVVSPSSLHHPRPAGWALRRPRSPAHAAVPDSDGVTHRTARTPGGVPLPGRSTASGPPGAGGRSPRLTWADVDQAADACAAGLTARGIRPGDRVGLFLGNRPELVIGYFGALRAGAVVVPINPALTAPEIRQLAEHVGSVLVVVDRGTAEVAAAATPDVPCVVVGAGPGDAGVRGAALGRCRDVGAGTARVARRWPCVIYTSGTVGRPQGSDADATVPWWRASSRWRTPRCPSSTRTTSC